MITDAYHFYEPNNAIHNTYTGNPMCKCGQNYECHIHFNLEEMLKIKKARQNSPNTSGNLYR